MGNRATIDSLGKNSLTEDSHTPLFSSSLTPISHPTSAHSGNRCSINPGEDSGEALSPHFEEPACLPSSSQCSAPTFSALGGSSPLPIIFHPHGRPVPSPGQGMFSRLGCFSREHPRNVQLGRGWVTAMEPWRLLVSPAFSSSPALPARPTAEQKESVWARRRREPRGDENLRAEQSPGFRQPRAGGSRTLLPQTEAREPPHPLVTLAHIHPRGTRFCTQVRCAHTL